jgi:hypothetical protein
VTAGTLAGTATRRRLPGREVPLLPETTEHRPLTGHTITLERAYGTNRVWLARRLHGELVATYRIPTEATAAQMARVLAGHHAARFLPPAEAAAVVAAASATLTTAQIVDMFCVSVSTVQRWNTRHGYLTNVAPPGRPSEFRAAEVQRVLCPGETLPLGTLITPQKAIKILFISATTLLRLTTDGRLSHVRLISGHRRYREAEVRALAAARRAVR